MKSKTQTAPAAAAHTPSQWRIGIHGSGEILDLSGNPINGIGREELVRQANAYPDLLAALVKCENVIGFARLQGNLSNSPFSPVNEALLVARAALAKALQ